MCNIKHGFGLFFLAIMLLSVSNVGSRAQKQDPFSTLPQGEEIIGAGKVGRISDPTTVYCTNHSLYKLSFTGKYSFAIWAPPAEAGEIYKMSIKVSEDFDSSGFALILTTSGRLFKVDIDTHKGEEISQSSANEAWSELCGDDLYLLSTSGHVWVTLNDTTWQVDTAGFGTARPIYLALDTSQNVFAASFNGVFEQGPSERTWHSLSNAPLTGGFYLFVSHMDVEYLSTNNGLMSSADHGATWVFDSTGMGHQLVHHISDDSLGNLYATSSYGSNANFVWMKPSGGTWRSIGAALGYLAYDSVKSVYQDYLTGVTADSGIHVATSFGLFSSYDVGVSWQPDNNGIAAEDIYEYYQFPDGLRIATTNLGLFTEAAKDPTWAKSFPQNSYLPGIKFFVDNAGRIYAFGTSRREAISNGSTFTYLYLPADIFISTDEGSTWLPDTNGISQFASKQGNYSMEFVDETGTEHIATFESPHARLFSKTSGGSWQGDSSGYQPQTGDHPSAFASDHHGSIYLAINNGASVYKLISRAISGGSWSEVSTSALGGVPYVFTATKDGKLIGGGANTKAGYYDGAVWNVIPSPPGQNNSFVFALSVDSSNRLWATYGTNSSYAPYVFSTTDLGQHWIPASDTSPTFASMVSFGDTTYGLNSGNGLFYFVSGSAGVKQPNANNARVCLYPNPSSGSVTIEASDATVAKVEIFDEEGKLINTLQGSTVGVWDGTASNGQPAANGTYIFRVTAKDKNGLLFTPAVKWEIVR